MYVCMYVIMYASNSVSIFGILSDSRAGMIEKAQVQEMSFAENVAYCSTSTFDTSQGHGDRVIERAYVNEVICSDNVAYGSGSLASGQGSKEVPMNHYANCNWRTH